MAPANTDAPRAATGKRSYKHLVGADGAIKSVVRKGDDVIDATTLGPRKGKRMRVAAGRHTGVECVVRKVDVDGEAGAKCRRSSVRSLAGRVPHRPQLATSLNRYCMCKQAALGCK
jgi:hypothetical protein